MAIYILEDNIFQARTMEILVSNVIEKEDSYDTNQKIKVFHKTNELIDDVSCCSESYNLYFLDLKIKNDEIAGFLTAKRIRERENNSLICFVTSYKELALTSYDYGLSAYAYIVKDSTESKFIEQLKNCISAYSINTPSDNEDSFIFESKNIKISCPFKELLFITPVSPHKLLIKTSTKEIYAHGSLKNFDFLDDRLIRCHQSFIINITKIKYIEKSKKEAVIDENISIPISRKKSHELREALDNHWKK
ncbi:LytR/AlgR family response regulator transcription factor [Enterococcus hulanensis]|uniref:LytR/AlgR family response regulator transcription factor n=1 Tax=Enterococcus hulanensis TaxID=2559929 RepID=UPI0010F92E61|nr:LytTR family DNA-binding domain-containing protein [Enterococcus hulanensis]